MKSLLATTAALLALTAPAFAESHSAGDATKGEKDYGKCKACHMIVAPDETVIMKGGKTGPNLYGIVGRAAGSVEGFKYGSGLVDAGAAGLIWTEENIAAYIVAPKGFLTETLGAPAKANMAKQNLKAPADVAAYLASVAPAN